MRTIAVLLTVFNRKAKTLECLKRLYSQLPLEGYQIDVFMTDDGCTDGTPEVVKSQYPQVNIIHGDGNLYWNRGMFIAWQEAAKHDYDYYLWLNDDTLLFPDALSNLICNSIYNSDKSIIVAAIRATKKETTTYSGYNEKGIVTPNGKLQLCSTFNGNCVLIPQFVYKEIGNLDWKFRHAIGDLDYGYRATRKGIKIYTSDKFLGICDKNSQLPVWARDNVPLKKRIKNLYSPLGYAEPIPFFHYELKNFGIMIAIKHFISIHIRVLFPRLWKQ